MNFAQIDAFLTKLKGASDDDHLRRLFGEYSATYDLNVPTDPFGTEYRDKQFELYRLLANRSYSTDNEKTVFDVSEAALRPFPYCHGSSDTVGNQLLAIGYLIKTMNLPKGARILEFGPGWGNTTLALAKMGYRVTAVDIEANFVELIRKRAAMESLEIDVVHGDFSYIDETEATYDAVLFFECFHHAQDHLAVMRGFDRVLDQGGIVCFGAEPINDEFPIPWGLRMDGESLWAIRNNGWLELGFSRKYFLSALDRFGWAGFEYQGMDGPWSRVIIAKRKSDVQKVYAFAQGALHSQVGQRVGEAIEVTGSENGYVVFGPYEPLPVGSWKVEVVFVEASPRTGILYVDVVDRGGEVRVAEERRFALDPKETAPCCLYFVNDRPLERFEMRVRCDVGTKVGITGLKLSFVPL